MSRSDRPRGVTVEVLDLTDLEMEALEWRQKTHPNAYEASIYGGQWAIAKKDGHLFAVCTEGVGYEVTDEEPMEFEFHARYTTINEETGEVDEHRTMFDVMPFASVVVIPEDLIDYPVKEVVDLADFVRVFGARLENNFYIWYEELM